MAAPEKLSLRALNRATLARQMLLRRERIPLVKAVSRSGGLQAQVPRPPFVALWSRVADFAAKDLVDAVTTHELVRATMMRATIHLMARADYLALRSAIQPALDKSATGVLRQKLNGLTTEEAVSLGRDFFEEAPRTFDELRKHVLAKKLEADERAVAYVVRMHLPLIQLPDDKARWAYPASARFAVAETWLGEPVDPHMNAEALAMHYLAAFGPASVQDFQTWSGLPTQRELFERLRKKLRVFVDEKGKELFDLPKAPRPDEDEEAPVRFLAEYDSLVLAHADRSRVISDAHRPLIYAAGNLQVLASFLVDGFVAGRYRIDRKKKTATITVEPFVALGAQQRNAILEEGERLLRFVEPDAAEHAVEMPKKPVSAKPVAMTYKR